MVAFLTRRVAGLVATLLAASLAIFCVMSVLPGDPAAIMLGTSARPDTLAALRARLSLDQPAPERYARWLGGIATGDLGTSLTYDVPVAGLIAERLAVTGPLAAMAALLVAVVAVPLGAAAAGRRGGVVDVAAGLVGQVGVAVPNFWLGLLLVLAFAVGLGWFPANGFPGWGDPARALAALVLPALALASPQIAVLTRVTRAAVLETLSEDYVRAARARGLTRGAALRRHALPNALAPILAIAGLQVTYLVAGSVLVENVFALPGLGRLATQAFAQRDLVVVQDVVLVFAGSAILVNGFVDVAQALVDPRARARA